MTNYDIVVEFIAIVQCLTKNSSSIRPMPLENKIAQNLGCIFVFISFIFLTRRH